MHFESVEVRHLEGESNLQNVAFRVGWVDLCVVCE